MGGRRGEQQGYTDQKQAAGQDRPGAITVQQLPYNGLEEGKRGPHPRVEIRATAVLPMAKSPSQVVK